MTLLKPTSAAFARPNPNGNHAYNGMTLLKRYQKGDGSADWFTRNHAYNGMTLLKLSARRANPSREAARNHAYNGMTLLKLR